MPAPSVRLLGLDEVADVDALGEARPRPQVRERADDRVVADLGTRSSTQPKRRCTPSPSVASTQERRAVEAAAAPIVVRPRS